MALASMYSFALHGPLFAAPASWMLRAAVRGSACPASAGHSTARPPGAAAVRKRWTRRGQERFFLGYTKALTPNLRSCKCITLR